MPAKIIYERFLWFHKQIKAEKYPNARILAQKFELSSKTAQRDIEFIRDRLNAPLVYIPSKRGYAYEDKTYDLPGIWINEEELAALFIASRLAATIPDRRLKYSFQSFLAQILSFRTLNTSFSLDELSEKISVKNIEYARVDEPIFQKIVDALFYGKALNIVYYSPHKDQETQRLIFPLHLLQYMGSWHVISHCALRNELRDFALARIRTINPSHKEMNPKFSSDSVKEYVRKNFGLFSRDTCIEVCLRFSPDIAPWVSEQIWHSEQKQALQSDGSLCLRFPVADLREIKREVLKYGAEVEVLAPVELRKAVGEEIEKMAEIY
jgi:predicted DNA-binding transcriptional regulator YafY